MKSVTIELQRFGEHTGILRRDRYLRLMGTSEPSEEVSLELDQAQLNIGMNTLDYSHLNPVATRKQVKKRADQFVEQIAPILSDFLTAKPPGGINDEPFQIEIVTRALELAQLPFEVLEGIQNCIITRRIRQAWPKPQVVESNVPRILFAWAAPRQKVPHERHEQLLDELLSDWGGVKEAVKIIPNASKKELQTALSDPDHGYTHIHLLAHGGQHSGDPNHDEDFDLAADWKPASHIALTREDGEIDCCSPQQLAGIFKSGIARPKSFTLATCHGSEIDPIEAGGSFAHELQSIGIPVVLASQLALTKNGSDELIKTFLAMIVEGDDPRVALNACRTAMRETRDKTFYDWIALTGYIDIDENLESRLPERKFNVALARLKAATKQAEDALNEVKVDDAVRLKQAGSAVLKRLRHVRDRLDDLDSNSLSKDHLEELRGLQASGCKREAEALWKLSQALPVAERSKWMKQSRDALSAAVDAYFRASRVSRDHHWTAVQWLVLKAVVEGHGAMKQVQDDWVIAKEAARDSVRSYEEKKDSAFIQDATWARGSLMELCLLSPLVGRGEAPQEARDHADALVAGCIKLRKMDAINSTLDQLRRYEDWWSQDREYQLPENTKADACKLADYLAGLVKQKT